MPPSPPPAARTVPLAAWLAVPPLFGLLAIWLGQDASWDLCNYHFYNPYAWLHGRMGFDVAPAQVATFYNPLLHLPFYLIVERLPPRAVGFLLGTLQGMNFPLLWGIGLALIPKSTGSTPRDAAFLSAVAALLGMLGAGQISELGTTFGDNLLSLPLLAALSLLLRAPPSPIPAAVAGLLCGIAAGLKQPMAVYAVGFCAAFFFRNDPFGRRILLALCFGLGVLAGIALSGGFWLVEMAQRFGNPLFPYFNQLFHSPWAAVADYRDARFIPASWGEALASPLYFALMPRKLAEVVFRDLRLPLLFLLLLTLLGRALHGRCRPDRPPRSGTSDAALRYLTGAGLISYLVWLKLFAIFRYAMLLEMLAPLGIFLAIARLTPTGRFRRPAWSAAALLILLTVVPADWGRVPWSGGYFGVQPPPLAEPLRTMVLMTGHEPSAYLIPFFPPTVRFLRIQSYFTGPTAQPNAFDRQMRRDIDGHEGPIFVLFRSYEVETTRNALRHFGLALAPQPAMTIQTHFETNPLYPLHFCAVERQGGAAPSGKDLP